MALLPKLMVIALIGIAVAGCGRQGPPLTPYESALEKSKKDGTPAPKKPETDKRIFLDKLLD